MFPKYYYNYHQTQLPEHTENNINCTEDAAVYTLLTVSIPNNNVAWEISKKTYLKSINRLVSLYFWPGVSTKFFADWILSNTANIDPYKTTEKDFL